MAIAASPARADSGTVLCGSFVTDAAQCGEDLITDSAKCGTKVVTDAVACGTEQVTDGVKCGTESVTDGAKCGWDTFTSAAKCLGDKNFYKNGSCKLAKKCSVPKSCNIAKSCSVAATCGLPKTCLATKPCGAPTTAIEIFRHAEPGLEDKCRPPSDTTTTGGCCGAPGIRGCVAQAVGQSYQLDLSGACTGPEDNKLRADPYLGGAPICNLPPPSCGPGVAEALASATTPATFYTTSDLHFFRGWDLRDHIAAVEALNSFARGRNSWQKMFRFPATQDDNIAEPRAIIVNGDVTLDSSSGNLGAYRLLWERGRHAEGIRYPVFFGLGNHDTTTQVSSARDAQRMYDYLVGTMNCPGISLDYVRATGTRSPIELAAKGPASGGGSGNYSWELGGVHHVQLNVWAGDTTSKFPHKADGLGWLRRDLAEKVGTSGRPVILHQHYDLSGLPAGTSWSWDDFNQFWRVIRDYNLIALFAGHSHQAAVVSYDTLRGSQPLLTNSAGVVQRLETFISSSGGGNEHRGGFIVARVIGNYLDVAHVEWQRPDNGPLAMMPLAKAYYGGPEVVGCRKRINTRFEPVDSVEITRGGQGNQRTVRLKPKPGAGPLTGSFAVKVHGLPKDNSLENRHFVDGCAWSDDNKPSPYLLLNDNAISTLSRGGLTVNLNFTKDPGEPTISLVQLLPLAGGAPAVSNVQAPVVSNVQAPVAAASPSPAPGSVIALYSSEHRRFLRITANGNVDSGGTVAGPSLDPAWQWERFRIVDGGNGQVALHVGAVRRFLRMNDRGVVDTSLQADVLDPGWAWERFQIIDAGNSRIALYSPAHRRFLRMKPDGTCDSGGPVAGPDKLDPNWAWERFQIVRP